MAKSKKSGQKVLRKPAKRKPQPAKVKAQPSREAYAEAGAVNWYVHYSSVPEGVIDTNATLAGYSKNCGPYSSFEKAACALITIHGNPSGTCPTDAQVNPCRC
jgi:hypothetical protein